MLWKTSALKGCAIRASDGEIGTVSDFLFDDASWLIRWMVVDTGVGKTWGVAGYEGVSIAAETATDVRTTVEATSGSEATNPHVLPTPRAEGCVDDIGNTRMRKRRRMRWSPKGAHRVAIVQAAVLDGRLAGSYRRMAA